MERDSRIIRAATGDEDQNRGQQCAGGDLEMFTHGVAKPGRISSASATRDDAGHSELIENP
jgi:hypothetical protein